MLLDSSNIFEEYLCIRKQKYILKNNLKIYNISKKFVFKKYLKKGILNLLVNVFPFIFFKDDKTIFKGMNHSFSIFRH